MTESLFPSMSGPPRHIDAVAARAAGEKGMAEALMAERVQAWKVEASKWLDDMPVGTEFTNDDLFSDIGNPDTGANRNNAVGGWTNAQAKLGRIESTNRMVKSQRVSRHGNRIMVWRKVK